MVAISHSRVGGPTVIQVVVPAGVFGNYDFARIHKTLRITPAMAAGISDHVWSYEEIVALAN
jgi:hypothetical protein